jgi:hypothetical protein
VLAIDEVPAKVDLARQIQKGHSEWPDGGPPWIRVSLSNSTWFQAVEGGETNLGKVTQ